MWGFRRHVALSGTAATSAGSGAGNVPSIRSGFDRLDEAIAFLFLFVGPAMGAAIALIWLAGLLASFVAAVSR